MATNWVYAGKRINTTNGSGSDVSSGGVIVEGDQVRVAIVDIANGASGACATEGVFTLAATSADVWSDGDVLWWDSTNAKLTDSAVSDVLAGIAIGDKASLATTANVKLSAGAAVPQKTSSVAVAAAALAIVTTHRFVSKTTGAGAEALTLADGRPGQLLTISLVVDGGGDGTLTPTTMTGFATIVLADAGDTVTLQFIDSTTGWIIIGSQGVAAPPVITI